jgi:cathepsin L
MDNAFKWIEKNGICTEATYPYTSGSGSSGTCKTTCAKAVTLTGFTDVPNEGAMLAALAKGPVFPSPSKPTSPPSSFTRVVSSTTPPAARSSTTAFSPWATALTPARITTR